MKEVLAAFVLNLVAEMSMFDDTKFQDSRQFFWVLLVSGFVFFFTIYARYRNADERHHYELETKNEISNLVCEDKFVKNLKGLEKSYIEGENSSELKGNRLDLTKDKYLKKAKEKGILDEVEENKKRLKETFENKKVK